MSIPDRAIPFDYPVKHIYKGEAWETIAYDWSYWYARKIADGEIMAIAKDQMMLDEMADESNDDYD